MQINVVFISFIFHVERYFTWNNGAKKYLNMKESKDKK